MPAKEEVQYVPLVPRLPPTGRAAVRGGVIGNYVDQINIFLPVVALAPALGTLGGPYVTGSTVALVVAATLLGRPFGSMIFGRLADRVGRTATTQAAIAGTAACSLSIAAVPDHEQIGVLAITLVLLLRLVGGIFLAGEYTSAIPLAMEWSPPRRRGLLSGLIMSMAPWAQSTIAFTTLGLLTVLGPQAYAAWGWRLAFVAGGCASLALLAYYRARVADVPAVDRAREVACRAPAALGLRAVLSGPYASAFWQAFGMMTGLWLMTNVVAIIVVQRLAIDLGLDGGQVALVMGVASVAQALGMVITGHASSVLGRRCFLVGWGVLAGVSGPALWLGLMGAGSVAIAAGLTAALQVLTVCGYGPVGAYLSERFPGHVRSTGYGTAYSLSIVAPALYPWWLPPLQDVAGQDGAIVLVLLTGGAVVAAMAACGPRLAPRDLDGEVEEVASRTYRTTTAVASPGAAGEADPWG